NAAALGRRRDRVGAIGLRLSRRSSRLPDRGNCPCPRLDLDHLRLCDTQERSGARALVGRYLPIRPGNLYDCPAERLSCMITPPACPRDTVIAHCFRPLAGFCLLVWLSSCGNVSNPASPPNDFSSGNFAMTIVAADTCSTLANPGRNRNWKIGLVTAGS